MSKTPTPNEARAALQRLREHVLDDDLIAALDVAIDHLPKPVLADGPYLYRSNTPDGARHAHFNVRFVKGGRWHPWVHDTLEPCELATGVEVTDPESYEPIVLIRGEGHLHPDVIERLAVRADTSRVVARRVITALIQEARG